MVAAQDGAGHGLLFALPQSHRLTDLIGWSVRLEDTGHPNIQAVVILPADGLGAGTWAVVSHVMLPTLVRCNHSALVTTPVHPALLVPATSPTDRARAAS